LLHLLELELGAKPTDVQPTSSGALELFMEVGQLCREVDAFLSERAKLTSPLLLVGMFERGQEWTDKLNAVQNRIQDEQDRLLAEAKEMNARWEFIDGLAETERGRQLPLDRLEQMYRRFSFLARWSEQIRERVLRLSC
jgi:hypothetical protein